MLLNTVVALTPVLLFLVALVLMDSFKLARPLTIAGALVCGGVAALVCDLGYDSLIRLLGTSPETYARYVAPIIEETAKAIFIVYLISRRHIGFPVDAAQLGFAVGAGFSLVENVVYLRDIENATVLIFFVRGVGTAVLHGATTAIFAMLSKTEADKHPDRKALIFLPGWAAAIVIHSLFNHVPLSPFAMMLLILAILPLLVVTVFQRSEKATHEWVGAGLDLDLELLNLVSSETFSYTKLGAYLRELKARFPGPIVTDMFCLLRVELELSVQAKAMLMAREAGLVVPVHQDAISALHEIKYLRGSIGSTGLLALKPLAVTSHRDDWHSYLLAQSRPMAARGWRAWVTQLFRTSAIR
jgi:RsiW-degrading membrane proteinase PrsW (M82 family)